MSVRITQNVMYSSYTRRMNTQLDGLMESNLQTSTQKRINRPSDDAAGTARIYSFRNSLDLIDLYKNNIKTAEGWVGAGDKVLSTETLNLMTRVKELATQGASETYMKENRAQIAKELRGLYGQLINIANTRFGDNYIFAGHKINQPAFVEGLSVSCHDSALANEKFSVEGGADYTTLIQATSSGPAETASFRYSQDGGITWKDATVDTNLTSPYTANQMRINAGGVGVIMSKVSTVTAVDPNKVNEKDNGTWIYAKPTAVYQGDDSRTEVVTPYGSTINAKAEGHFSRDVSVRIDKVDNNVISYSYSYDDGQNWQSGQTAAAGANTKLAVPGGYLSLSANPTEGEQFVIHPRRADVSLFIAEGDSMSLNMVGMNVFGGMYQDPDPSVSPGYPTVVPGEDNLFEILGDLIAAAETGSSDGMANALPKLDKARVLVSTAAAEYGARSNRLSYSFQGLEARRVTEEEGLSRIEDVDFAELNTRLAKQETAYRSVLKSSSMIMQMSLINFL